MIYHFKTKTMEFTAFLETNENYDPNDVINTFDKIIKLGLKELNKQQNLLFIKIAKELDSNSIIIERT